jgi:O-antigen/teichoic acid export membrane protein
VLKVKLVSFIQKTITDIIGIVTSRQRIKQLLGNSLYRNALYLLFTNIVTPATGFVFWIIVARVYKTEDVGIASALISALGVIWLVANLGLGAGIVRFLPQAGNKSSAMINTVFTTTGLASIIVSGVFVAGLSFWSPKLLFLQHDFIYLFAFIAFAVCNGLMMMSDWPFIAYRKSNFTLVKGLVFGLLRLPLVIPLVAVFGASGIFASWGLSTLVSFAVSVFLFLPRVQPDYRPFPFISRSVLSDILPYSLANNVSGLLWYLPTSILPIMVLNLVGTEANAYFYIAWIVGGVLTAIPIAASSALFAEGSHNERELSQHFWRSIKLTFLILIPSVIVVIAIADKLLLLFGSSYSSSGVTLLRILALSALPMSINYLYMALNRVQKNLKMLISLSSFIMVASLAFSYWLLPLMGVNGAGLAWLGSQTIIAIAIIIGFLMRRPLLRE